MIINTIKPFDGKHCETTATGTILRQIDIDLSEPMLFGLGEALGFIYWNMKTMDFPFMGGRVKPDELTQNIAKNLQLELTVNETTSAAKAWQQVKHQLDNQQCVGLKLDCFHLEYFSKAPHFAGHYVAIYGYDEQFAYLIDTKQQGGRVKTSLQSLAAARSEKGPMSSKNLSYTLQATTQHFDMHSLIRTAIKNNAKQYLNPPINNIGFKGIAKASTEIEKWFDNSKNITDEFSTAAMMMEKAGTGGALFRNLYRDFLFESYQLMQHTAIQQAYDIFVHVAANWSMVADLFVKTAQSHDKQYVKQASEILKNISVQEKKAMEILTKL